MDKTNLKIKKISKNPIFTKEVYIASGAKIIGDVTIKNDSSVWYNSVLRGDINSITIGKRSNIQDNSVIHVENDEEVIIGDDVTIGHNCILHGCKIGNAVLVRYGCNYNEWFSYRRRICNRSRIIDKGKFPYT